MMIAPKRRESADENRGDGQRLSDKGVQIDPKGLGKSREGCDRGIQPVAPLQIRDILLELTRSTGKLVLGNSQPLSNRPNPTSEQRQIPTDRIGDDSSLQWLPGSSLTLLLCHDAIVTKRYDL